MLNSRRSIGVFWALVGIVSGSLILGPAARAGFQPGTGTGLPPTLKSGPCFDASNIGCTCPAGTPARLACDDQRAYYAYSIPVRFRPYVSMQAALHDALMASYWNQAAELPGEGEWGSMIYKDRYGLYWFTAPMRGVVLPDGSWITMLNTGSISRPGSTVVASEHTHPKGTSHDPTGSGTTNGGDNQSDHPMFVIKGDDTVWYFPPNTERALFDGVISGDCSSNEVHDRQRQPDRPSRRIPYKMAAASNTAGSSDFSWVDFATAVSVVIGGRHTHHLAGGVWKSQHGRQYPGRVDGGDTGSIQHDVHFVSECLLPLTRGTI